MHATNEGQIGQLRAGKTRENLISNGDMCAFLQASRNHCTTT